MDCLEAQRTISEALDREPLDPDLLEEAKQHCRECDDCAAFVRALNLVKRAPAPEPPTDLADRIVERVRAEAAASQSAETHKAVYSATQPAAMPTGTATGQARPESGSTTAEPSPSGPSGLLASLMDRAKRPENRSYVIAYASAAAVLLLFVGAVGYAGVRTITSPSAPAPTSSSVVAGTQRATVEAAPNAQLSGSAAASATFGGPAPKADVAGATAPTDKYVLFNGVVYRYTAPSTEPSSALSQVGVVTSALGDAAGTPTQHLVYSGTKGSIVIDNAGVLWAYDPVTRLYNGVTYALASAPLERYGVWPTMPPPLEAPANPDGSPGFTKAGTSAGITVYTRLGETAQAGIAVPPDTPPSDPAAGNPNWTWWAPKH